MPYLPCMLRFAVFTNVSRRRLPGETRLLPQAKNGTNSVVDGVHDGSRELTRSVDQPRAVNQLKAHRYRDGVYGQPGDRRLAFDDRNDVVRNTREPGSNATPP